jgi:signal transduction histidine kinase
MPAHLPLTYPLPIDGKLVPEMNRLSTPAPTFQYRVLIFTVLTVLFTLLHYMGSALYTLAGGLTTVKPYSGIALALILIMGESWLVPVLLAGTLGGMVAKLANAAPLYDVLITPSVTSLTLLAIYAAMRRLIAKQPDFRAWHQLVGYITLTTAISFISATVFTLAIDGPDKPHLGIYWQAWFIPTALSYVIFTPVLVLLATAERSVLAGNWRRLTACFVLMSAVLALNFLPVRLPLLFTTPMALLIVTLAAGLEGTALGLVLTQLVLTGLTALGYGASAIAYLPLGYQLYFIQVFMAIIIAVMLPVAAAIAERVKLRDSMQQALGREAQVNIALRTSEQRALDMAAEAQRANHAKSEFLASMSHELRTPLNAILGFTEILKSELYGPLGHNKYREYTEDVYKSGIHLLDLINDVLDLSKIDAGKMELRDSVFSVRELVADAVHLVRDRAAGHVQIRVLVADPCDILADKRLMKQVLLNLLSNAIKFTPEGGAITVGADQTLAGFEITVADTGIGMNEAQLQTAFSHYGQVDSKIARTQQGTGLGLPIAQALARLHGGDLIATSTPGHGTCMTLTLPACRCVRGEPDALLSVG